SLVWLSCASVDDGAVGKDHERQASGLDEMVERHLHVLQGCLALTCDPPAANSFGRIGGQRVLRNVALDDLGNHQNPLAIDRRLWNLIRGLPDPALHRACQIRERKTRGVFRPDRAGGEAICTRTNEFCSQRLATNGGKGKRKSWRSRVGSN